MDDFDDTFISKLKSLQLQVNIQIPWTDTKTTNSLSWLHSTSSKFINKNTIRAQHQQYWREIRTKHKIKHFPFLGKFFLLSIDKLNIFTQFSSFR